jgi:hypothetical protein
MPGYASRLATRPGTLLMVIGSSLRANYSPVISSRVRHAVIIRVVHTNTNYMSRDLPHPVLQANRPKPHTAGAWSKQASSVKSCTHSYPPNRPDNHKPGCRVSVPVILPKFRPIADFDSGELPLLIGRALFRMRAMQVCKRTVQSTTDRPGT